jgi:hypothetical protein
MTTDIQKALEGASLLAGLLRQAAKENLGEKLELALQLAASQEQAVRERESKLAQLDAESVQRLADLESVRGKLAEQSKQLEALNIEIVKARTARDEAVKAYESFLKSLPGR